MPRLEANGVVLRYRMEGDGPSVVLVHELGGGLASWDGVMPHLAGLRTLRLDLRGAGGSESPRAEFSVADQAADLAALLAALELPPPWHLVGAAAGNAVLVQFAARVPGAASLLACCPALEVDPERRAYLLERAALAERAGMRAVADRVLARSWPEDVGGDRAGYRRRLIAADPVGYAHANRALATHAPGDGIAALRLPCLVIAGERDLLRPPDAVRETAARIVGARCETLPGGHLMAVQAPDALGRRIRRFLEEGA